MTTLNLDMTATLDLSRLSALERRKLFRLMAIARGAKRPAPEPAAQDITPPTPTQEDEDHG